MHHSRETLNMSIIAARRHYMDNHVDSCCSLEPHTHAQPQQRRSTSHARNLSNEARMHAARRTYRNEDTCTHAVAPHPLHEPRILATRMGHHGVAGHTLFQGTKVPEISALRTAHSQLPTRWRALSAKKCATIAKKSARQPQLAHDQHIT